MLFDAGADPNGHGSLIPPLAESIDSYCIHHAIRLIKAGANVNAVYNSDHTAAHAVARNFHMQADIITALIDHGADFHVPRKVDDIVVTPFIEMVINHPSTLAKYILAHGKVNSSQYSEDQCTVLHVHAREGGRKGLTELLVLAGFHMPRFDYNDTTEILQKLERSFIISVPDGIDSKAVWCWCWDFTNLAPQFKEHGRQLIRRASFEQIRERAAEIAIGLAGLRLPALLVCGLVEEQFVHRWPMIPLDCYWSIAVAVKHFRAPQKRRRVGADED